MNKNEILLSDSLKLYEAPPVANESNNNFIIIEKKNNLKIINNDRFSIFSHDNKINEKNNDNLSILKIKIDYNILRKQDKKVLLDIIDFIKQSCILSLLPNYFYPNNESIIIKKNISRKNELVMVLEPPIKEKNEVNNLYNKNKNSEIINKIFDEKKEINKKDEKKEIGVKKKSKITL